MNGVMGAVGAGISIALSVWAVLIGVRYLRRAAS
jgi:hypothetical protein